MTKERAAGVAKGGNPAIARDSANGLREASLFRRARRVFRGRPERLAMSAIHAV
jgi:hypothetical protein